MTILLISNSESAIRNEIHTFLEQHFSQKNIKKIEALTHPDIHFVNGYELETIGIADVRSFTKILHKKPFKAAMHVGIILGFEKATVEAQNALLKEFEDHPPTVSYILGVIEENNILPTIRSRATVKYIDAALAGKESKDADKFIGYFLNATEDLLEGFSLVQKKEWTRITAEQLLTKIFEATPKDRTHAAHLATLQKCGEYLKNNVSPKQVLTYLLLNFRYKI